MSSKVNKTNVVFTGVTGYIGGTVFSQFLNRADLVATHNIRVLVRSAEKAEKLKAFGVEAIVGSHDDSALVEKLAEDADVFFSNADSDHLPAAKATLAGLKKRYEKTGIAPIVIHTSGTGVLGDEAPGVLADVPIYDDSNPDQIATLPITQFHRDVDLEYENADKQGYIRSHIILPAVIYGIPSNELVDAGIQSPIAIAVPVITRYSLARGRAGMVGSGTNIWPSVHIDDTADLYLKLYDTIQADTTRSKVAHGREGYYFAANGEYNYYELTKAIGEALVALGRIKDSEPTTLTDEELEKYAKNNPFLNSNSRCVATRSFAIGWRPKYTEKDFLGSVQSEVEFVIKKRNL